MWSSEFFLAYLSNYLVGLLQFGDYEVAMEAGHRRSAGQCFFFLTLFGIPRSPRLAG